MQISSRDKGLRKSLEDEAECQRRFGKDMARKILMRISALLAAESLADFWPPNSGPERCHELVGDKKGVFSMDVKQPYRLLFVPAEVPPADCKNDQERWKAVKAVELLTIEDTHG